MNALRILLSLIVLFLIAKCTNHTGDRDDSLIPAVPGTFDSLPPIPVDNQLTKARIELGRMLFHEPLLSGDGIISCASCHKAALAFADDKPVSAGVHGRLDKRNSPSLINVAYQQRLFLEGGIPNLEIQILAPFGNENEMDFSLRKASEILNELEVYQKLAMAAYGSEISGLVISKALSNYQRSLLSSGSPYDAYVLGDQLALNEREKRGMTLFFSGELACSSCHSGFLFTDQDFYNIGLYAKYNDEGRGRLTLDQNDLGKIKTPSLRNVGLTAPYMHDGSLPTLDEVLLHFNSGGVAHANKDARIRKLGLDDHELRDLKAFLLALTDTVMPG